MGLFKSREERRIERDLEVRKGLNSIRRSIKDLERHQQNYVEKAKRAKQINDAGQLDFIKKALRKTAAQRRLRERQLLSVETAIQMKSQVESDAEFAKAMLAVSTSIAELYGATDLTRTQKEFERAMAQAASLQERVEIFLDTTADSALAGDADALEAGISDADIDRMIDEEVVHDESAPVVDEAIRKGLREISEELGREEN
ncbi:MAG: hypothetical protein HZA54_02055 [Planctomycetes bacterium]|nr:hypothetical protein [Planctomycetota bacterium]